MSDRLFASSRKGLFTIARAQGKWEVVRAAFLGDNVTLVSHDARSGTLFAALDHGHFGVKLHRSRDGGETWQESAVPVYPTPPEGAEPPKTPDGKIIPQTLKLIWALEPGGKDQPGVLWCGTAPGALFRSNDGGDSWELNEFMWRDPRRKEWFGGGYDWPAIHSICVDPRNSKHVTLAVSCGGVWKTFDGGAMWDTYSKGIHAEYMPPDQRENPNIQDVHHLAMSPANPDVMWAQHHNGIFHTEDGGKQWRVIEKAGPSTFGFAVAAHPKDPNTAWFVPAIKDEKRIPVDGKVVVTRTRDGGRSFDVLTDGLPQHHAYDLIFRHALDVDESGGRLAFGSTTGSLWVTENGGDRWQCVSSHLPPIHCVRFA